MANPPVSLPVINGSTGTWGTILNQAIRDIEGYLNTNAASDVTQGTDITQLKTDVNALKATNTVGMMAVSTSLNRPTPTVGLMGLETDTGYMYYVASVSGTPTRVPFPGQYLAKIKQTNSQNFTQGNGAALTLHTADMNRLNGWTSGSRYSAQVPGVYEFTGAITFGANATGYRSAIWYKQGAAFNGAGVTIPATPITPTSAPTTVVARPTIIGLNVGEYVELYGVQSGAATLATDASAIVQSGMQVKYLGYYGT